MSFVDDVIAEDLDFLFEDAGTTVTYTPVTGAPFSCRVILGPTYRDEFETNDTRLKRECRVLHSAIHAAGLSVPIDQVRGGASDSLGIPNPDGTSETWLVTGKTYSAGIWVLMLSRNVRVRS